ncbi:efflux RND transporter periplasmic adaptor subunit [Paenibacillus agricola]|uniref:Efflux RND transporter periplasmic adaptor subunit n=1 Tax=Paenibacillus agricola TaxID=2716264 RepID=A0ABX0J9F9_9BACL|nr:efflux RND transporter periplasmic adaptor subunit [Paenibacillus agricola]NHN33082.1 efflux RND transporter periplasmic adaptor subunit [Paenibacillus agricola]
MKPNQAVYQGIKLAGAIVISAALLVGCTEQPQAAPKEASTNESQLKLIKTAPIEKKKISEPLEQVADVAASLQIDIVTKAGGDIMEIAKKRGDNIEKGEVILRLDPTDILIQKEKANITVSGTQQQMGKALEDVNNGKQELSNGIIKLEAALKDTEKSYSKLRNDYDLGLATKNQLELLETQLNGMKLDLETNRSKLKTLDSTNSLAQLEQGLQMASVSIREADRTIDNMTVNSSVSGVLTDLPVEEGMTITAGFRVAQIQQLDPIKIKAELTEEAADLIRGKEELTYYVPGKVDKEKAKVSYLSDIMSASSQSYSLELQIPNPDRKLKPGMKAQIQLAEEQDQVVITVPSLSIVRENGETFVFVLAGDLVEKRKIELGRLNETFQEVISGVNEGEKLVISGQNQLKDKEKVQVAP